MSLNPDRPARRSPRLKGYDYSQNGAYFVTICTQRRECLFGNITGGEMHLNSFGEIVKACWENLPHHYQNLELDAFVVMPNHVHAIILIVGDGIWTTNGVGESLKPSPTSKPHGLPEVGRGFKTFSARRISELRDMPGAPVWQRSYHDHIIRDVISLNIKRQYIETNPAHWETDQDNPIRSQ